MLSSKHRATVCSFLRLALAAFRCSDAAEHSRTGGDKRNQAGHDVQDRGEATSKLLDEQSIFLLPAQPEGSQGIKRKRTH